MEYNWQLELNYYKVDLKKISLCYQLVYRNVWGFGAEYILSEALFKFGAEYFSLVKETTNEFDFFQTIEMIFIDLMHS